MLGLQLFSANGILEREIDPNYEVVDFLFGDSIEEYMSRIEKQKSDFYNWVMENSVIINNIDSAISNPKAFCCAQLQIIINDETTSTGSCLFRELREFKL